MKQTIKDGLCMFAGAGCMAVAVNIVFEPTGMVTGGFSGLGILIHTMTSGFFGGIPVWVVNAVLNVPLFFYAYRIYGKKRIGRMLGAAVLFTALLGIIPVSSVKEEDFLLASVMGGVLNGTGLGLVCSGKASTGGTDLLASLLSGRFRQYSSAKFLMFIDSFIVILGIFVFDIRHVLYSVIAVYVTSKVMDMILEGLHFAKAAFIISEKEGEVISFIQEEMKRGATLVPVVGAYENREKRMILCAVGKKEISVLIHKIKEIDHCAFLIILDVREVYGEGFMQENESFLC